MITNEQANQNRDLAKQNGEPHFEGKPCARAGHTLRYVTGRDCVKCRAIAEVPRRGEGGYHRRPYVLEKKKKVFAKWFAKNKEKHYKNLNIAHKKKYKEDATFRTFHLIQTQLHRFLKSVGTKKEARTHEILGYSAKELHDHLESQFQEGMTWENQGNNGGWHIDHIKPQSYFTKDQVKECFALDNLKPEWQEWNLWKSNRFIGSSEDNPVT